MIAATRYLLADFVRSRRFVAPALALAAGVVVLYAQPPNPVLSTASSVIAPLFACQCWMALAFFNSQGAADRHVLAVAAGGRGFVLGRMLAGGLLAAVSAVLVVAYPLLAGRFDRRPTLLELAVILLATLTAALGATGLAALFARPLLYNRAISVLGLAVCAVFTVPARPPGSAVATAHALDAGHVAQVPARLGGDVGSAVIFVAAVGVFCGRCWRRRE